MQKEKQMNMTLVLHHDAGPVGLAEHSTALRGRTSLNRLFVPKMRNRITSRIDDELVNRS